MLLTSYEYRVVPGARIGHVSLGIEAARASAVIGRESTAKGALGQYWATWHGKSGNRLDVHYVRSRRRDGPNRVTVDIVRVTSSQFELANGLRTGKASAAFQKRFPDARPVGSYRNVSGQFDLWDDVRRGLAWEVGPSGSVSALIVHRTGSPVAPTIGPFLKVEP